MDTPQSAPKPATDDNYDLGDTGLNLQVPDKSAASPESPPRNPDGTFAKKAPEHDTYLVEQAKQFGISDDEIAEMSPTLLNKTVYRHMKRELELHQQHRKERTHADAEVRNPEPEPEEEFKIDWKKHGLNPDDFQPEYLAALEGVIGERFKESQATKKELAELRAREQRREEQASHEVLDDAFASLGPDYESVFGKGSAGDMPRDSEQLAARIFLIKACGIDPSKADRRTKQLIAQGAKFMRKGEEAKPSKDNPYEGKPESRGPSPADWARATLASPTQRAIEEMPEGDERATRNLERKLREGPAEKKTGDAEVLDGLLG